jgi:uncharacterized protein YuzE
LDEETLLDLDRDGNIAGITVEHASKLTFRSFPTSRLPPDFFPLSGD